MKRLAIDRFYVSFKSAILLSALLFALCAAAEAQQPGKVYRIGILMSPSAIEMTPFIDAFRQNLRELGYLEGKNIVLEIREGRTETERIVDLTAELVKLKVDVIVAEAGPAVVAAKRATSTNPIVIREKKVSGTLFPAQCFSWFE